MVKITLDHTPFIFDESFLPCLITGACKSGASYFSVSLIANMIEGGAKVIFFTAFPMAKEELFHQIGTEKTFEVSKEIDILKIPNDKSIIVQSGNKELRKKTIQNVDSPEDYIIFVKNFEEYDASILEMLQGKKKIIISGSMDDCRFQQELAEKERTSKVIFTMPEIDLHIDIPELEKYESYLISEQAKGILRIENDR